MSIGHIGFDMGLLSKLVGNSIAEPIQAITGLVDEVYTSKDEKLTHAEVMERIKQTPKLAQIELNSAEAKHRTWFVAGWRPSIGWVCSLGLLNHFLINPWIQWATCLFGDECIKGPDIDIASMIGIVTAMLGLGYLRTEEKKAGVTK